MDMGTAVILFRAVCKEPAYIESVQEIGLADELGSDMRNIYKYTRLYSGGTPEFIEDDVFRTIVPFHIVPLRAPEFALYSPQILQ